MQSFVVSLAVLALTGRGTALQATCDQRSDKQPQEGYEPMHTPKTGTPNECCSLCLQMDACIGYTYDASDEVCELLDEHNEWAIRPPQSTNVQNKTKFIGYKHTATSKTHYPETPNAPHPTVAAAAQKQYKAAAKVQSQCTLQSHTQAQPGHQPIATIKSGTPENATPTAISLASTSDCCSKCWQMEDCIGFSFDGTEQVCTLLNEDNEWSIHPASRVHDATHFVGYRKEPEPIDPPALPPSDPKPDPEGDTEQGHPAATDDKPKKNYKSGGNFEFDEPELDMEQDADTGNEGRKSTKDNQVPLIIGLVTVGGMILVLLVGITVHNINTKESDTNGTRTESGTSADRRGSRAAVARKYKSKTRGVAVPDEQSGPGEGSGCKQELSSIGGSTGSGWFTGSDSETQHRTAASEQDSQQQSAMADVLTVDHHSGIPHFHSPQQSQRQSTQHHSTASGQDPSAWQDPKEYP